MLLFLLLWLLPCSPVLVRHGFVLVYLNTLLKQSDGIAVRLFHRVHSSFGNALETYIRLCEMISLFDNLTENNVLLFVS